MKITIYQINLDRDEERVAFQGYDSLGLPEDSPGEINSEIYDAVFSGEVECRNLEEVYRMFNLDHPEGYRGRSLSVSDIVCDESGEEPRYYFCDSIGFREVQFDPDLTESFKEPQITVVMCKPGEKARLATIRNDLASLQNAVGGDIEAFYPFGEEPVCIICNEEGKFNGMQPCRAVYEPPKEVEMSYQELRRKFHETEKAGKTHITGYIVFTEDSFPEQYTEAERTYAVSSNNKAFIPGMGGYSIYGSSLDGNDPCVRLERYMIDERGGADGWKIERCYMLEPSKEIMDIIFGPFFICGCGSEHFSSLTKAQQEQYLKQFEKPEQYFRVNGGIEVIPYEPRENVEPDRG